MGQRHTDDNRKEKVKDYTNDYRSSDMTKNDETYSFDVSPIIEDGRTLVPIRAIAICSDLMLSGTKRTTPLQ